MNMTGAEYNAEIERLAAKYGKFGFDEGFIRNLVEKSSDAGFDLESALLAVRVGFAMEYPEAGEELFNIQEVSHALGLSEDEVLTEMQNIGATPITISTGIRFEEDSE